MPTKVIDNSADSRFELYDDDQRVGFVEYHRFRNEIAFLHTEIDPRFEGKGYGSALAKGVLDEARAQGWGVLPYCSFIRGWMLRHHEYGDLVPDHYRERFGF